MADQEKPRVKMTFQEIIQSSKEIDQLDDGEYDDGDYAAVPVESDYKPKTKKDNQPVVKKKVNKKPQPKVAEKQQPSMVSKKTDARGKNYALKASWEKRSSVAPFE
ncbi:MAG: hypothetical protein P8Y24_12430 [Gammaproteobacteria bacterium]